MNKKKTNSKVKKSPKRIIICSVVDLAPEWMFSCKEDVCFIYHGKDPRIKNKLREIFGIPQGS